VVRREREEGSTHSNRRDRKEGMKEEKKTDEIQFKEKTERRRDDTDIEKAYMQQRILNLDSLDRGEAE